MDPSYVRKLSIGGRLGEGLVKIWARSWTESARDRVEGRYLLPVPVHNCGGDFLVGAPGLRLEDVPVALADPLGTR